MTEIEVKFEGPLGLVRIDRSEDSVGSALDRLWGQAAAAALSSGQSNVSARSVVMPWATFLSLAQTFRHSTQSKGVKVAYQGPVETRLREWVRDTNSIAQTADPIVAPELALMLSESDWDDEKRSLTDEQIRDLGKVLSRPHSAIFSVPGAGKTTVLMAAHQIWALTVKDPMLLVVAPLNAFGAWDEVVTDCLINDSQEFARLVGGASAIAHTLASKPRYAIISYGQVPNAAPQVLSSLMGRDVHVVLDESHKIKAGMQGVQAREVLRIAPFARRREILSGTPMPQSQLDLVAQFEFLYPSSGLSTRIADATNVRAVIAPLFARTRYSELGVPEPIVNYESVEMSGAQRLLYTMLRDAVLKARVRKDGPADLSRVAVMRLLQMAIDPQGAAQSLLMQDEYSQGTPRDLCEAVLAEGLSPRLARAVELVSKFASDGEKVVVWAPFTATVKRLSQELSEFGAREYFGATPVGAADELGTREQIIREFHDSNSCNVLVANPAAGSEGISLHRVCHRALYVGRTYNATHYLQSRDRINRLGMPDGAVARMTVLESTAPQRVGSIDLSVRRRLDLKVQQLADALNDDDLKTIALESEDADQELDDGFTLHDLLDLLDELES